MVRRCVACDREESAAHADVADEVRADRSGHRPLSAGRIIFCNGAPSTGKTTLVKEIQARCPVPLWHLSLDDFLGGYTTRGPEHFNAGDERLPTDRPKLELDRPWWQSVHEHDYDVEVDTSSLETMREGADRVVVRFLEL